MSKPVDHDVIVVGGGHNGLTCACYLAKAGYDVLVLERRDVIGGAVVTEEIFPGYQIDTCSTFHVIIHVTPVVKELELEKFGLDYMDMDPFAFIPFSDGTSLTFYRDLDRTCAEIAKISAKDAQAYHDFITLWGKFNQVVFHTFLAPPNMGAMLGTIFQKEFRNLKSFVGLGSSDELMKVVLGSYGQVVTDTFQSPKVRAAIAWLAAQSGPGPNEIGSGELAGSISIYHQVGMTHPRGGSGMLTQAMARCLHHHGGKVRLDAEVKRILVKENKAQGVELITGEQIRSRVVISNAHVQTTLLKLLDSDVLEHTLQRKVGAIKVANGMGMTVRCSLDELPNYTAAPSSGAAPLHNSMQLISPSLEYLQRAYDECSLGLPPTRPAVVAMTPSALDRAIAPPGKHSIYFWAQYHPYTLSNGERWEEVREREADKIIDTVAQYAPNLKGAITGRYIKTPVDLEEIGGLVKGHLMHVDMSLDQMFMFRPLPELSQYRTPIVGLYLTGASTHPGGGVSGASGHNTARVVLGDLRQTRRKLIQVAISTVAGAATLASLVDIVRGEHHQARSISARSHRPPRRAK